MKPSGTAVLHPPHATYYRKAALFTPSNLRLILPACLRDCEFSLDFSNGTMEARSLFGVSTVSCGEPGARETLEIAQIKGVASVDTLNKASGACGFIILCFSCKLCVSSIFGISSIFDTGSNQF